MMKPPPDTELIDFPGSILWFDKEDGFMCAISKKKPPSTIEDIKKSLKNFKEIMGDDRICILIDVTNASEMSREGREYVAKEFPKLFKAIAMISGSVFGKMVANLFFTIKTQPYPTKMFTDEKEARKWLRQYV
ncbi:MAG: STAS/SEC14 domain-containing protein [Balneolales bacterium]